MDGAVQHRPEQVDPLDRTRAAVHRGDRRLDRPPARGADRLPARPAVLAPPLRPELAARVGGEQVQRVPLAAEEPEWTGLHELPAERPPARPAPIPEEGLELTVVGDREHVELVVIAPHGRDPGPGGEARRRVADRPPQTHAALPTPPDGPHAAVGGDHEQVPVARLAGHRGERRARGEGLARQRRGAQRPVRQRPDAEHLPGGVDPEQQPLAGTPTDHADVGARREGGRGRHLQRGEGLVERGVHAAGGHQHARVVDGEHPPALAVHRRGDGGAQREPPAQGTQADQSSLSRSGR